jgi:predicted phage terminase large subunit-like protein
MSTLAALLSQSHGRHEVEIELEKEECQRSLATFVRLAWPHFDPVPYQHGWHIDCVSEHLEACTAGQIRALIINIPPRFMKTSILVLWNVWTWTLRRPAGGYNYLRGPGVTFLAGAYNSTKAESDGRKARLLLRTEWFQERWGDAVEVSPYIDNAQQFNTTAGGHRINVGIPESMGKGGIIRTLDDPSKADDVESDAQRETVNRNYDEIWSSRSNDPEHGCEVVVMQRLAHNDLTGHLLDKGGFEHLSLPLEYDPTRHCVTSIGWEDPRGLDDDTGEFLDGVQDKKGGGVEVIPGSELEERVGEPLWPERYSKAWCRAQEEKIGPHAFAAQYQQIPSPRGGGYIKAEWWRLWEKVKFPDCDLVVVSMDGALTEKTANDPSAIQVWGRFMLGEIREPQFILMWSWAGRCAFHELVERVGRACSGDWRGIVGPTPTPDGGTKADILLIENKANGRPVGEEVVKLHGKRKWRTILVTPRGDKLARLLSVQHLFSGLRTFNGETTPGQIWAPDMVWAQECIDEVAAFPKAGHDDRTDAASQALWWMRQQGAAATKEEAEDDWLDRNRYRKPRQKLYPC